MEKCQTCFNSRAIISENGLHYICSLSTMKAVNCITKTKDYYIKIKSNKSINNK